MSQNTRDDGVVTERPAGAVTLTRPASADRQAQAPRPGRGGKDREGARPATSGVPRQRAGQRRTRRDRPEPERAGPRTAQRRRPAATVVPPRPAAAAAPARPRGLSPAASNRMPFIVLLCGLLGGALVSALVISTTLADGSFEISKLQQSNKALLRQRQTLQDDVARAQSAPVIQQRAYQLGLRPVGQLRFVNLKTGKIATDAGSKAVSAINVPGYTP